MCDGDLEQLKRLGAVHISVRSDAYALSREVEATSGPRHPNARAATTRDHGTQPPRATTTRDDHARAPRATTARDDHARRPRASTTREHHARAPRASTRPATRIVPVLAMAAS